MYFRTIIFCEPEPIWVKVISFVLNGRADNNYLNILYIFIFVVIRAWNLIVCDINLIFTINSKRKKT